MGDERIYRVGLGVVTLDGLFQDDLRDALRASWIAGASVTRYRRRWNLSRVHQETDELMVGRIGFVGESEVSTVFFDYDDGDFVQEGVPSGVLVPFGIRLSDGLVAYQLRPGIVGEESFAGAFAALLNSAANECVWSVKTAVEYRSWEDWRADVSSVTAFNFRLDRPNPHYADDDRVESIIEDIRLEYARLAGKAREGEGVNTEDDLFRQAVDHVLRNYGRAAVDGVTPDGRESTWVKVKNLAASVVARLTVTAQGGDEIPEEELVAVLHRERVGRSGLDLAVLEEDIEEQ